MNLEAGSSPDLWAYCALFGAGLLGGILNVLAGGGSFLTLPILIFLGLPPSVANGTNRVGILLQNSAAVLSFRRGKMLQRELVVSAALPAILGAVLGTAAALAVGDEAFKRLLAILMVAVTLWTLLSPAEAAENRRTLPRGLLVVGFFLVGVYGGFVQAGVGFLFLAVTSAAGLDLVRGNSAKVSIILIFTVISLAIFAVQGRVDWAIGLILGIGAALGGWLGARLTMLKGHAWVRGVVTLAVIVFAIRLWFS